MAQPKVRYFQTCDFCHQEYETDEKGMCSIKLPGYYIGEYGSKSRTIVSCVICSECMDRLSDLLDKFISIEEFRFAGNKISWVFPEEEKNNGNA